MAIAFVAATSAAGSSVTATSISVTMPTGSVGDLLLVSVSNGAASAPSGHGGPTITAGSSNMFRLWALAVQGGHTAVFYRIVQSGDPTSYSFTASAGATMSACAVRYSGVDSTTPFRNWNYTGDMDLFAHTETSATFPVLDNVQSTDLVVALAAYGKGSTSTTITALSTPSGWTQRVTKTGPTSSSSFPVTAAVYDKVGATDTPSVTGQAGKYFIFSIALVSSPDPDPDQTGGTITFRNASTVTGASAATSVTVSKPSGVVDGDLMILVAGQSFGACTYAPPTGWQSISIDASGYSLGTSSEVFEIATQIWYKFASGEPSSYTVGCTATGGSVDDLVVAIAAYTGPRNPYPIKLHGTTTSATGTAAVTTSPAPMALPSVKSDNLIVNIYVSGADPSGSYTVTGPSGWNQRAQVIGNLTSGSGGFNASITIADKLGATTQPTAAASISQSWTVHSIALVGTPPVSALPPPPIMQTPLAPRLYSVNW